ncbi:hypothetical protein [Peribacillus asahii]|uniref:hypothetical protein n=1 Tax=Peribacillus asahii TaxID=228899 RepID=UPI00207A98EC|nr:hypothetical protein [Peribacillus asahii]USK72725.1 hypothetical protein LIS76_23660 [Peribacillus asahii]
MTVVSSGQLTLIDVNDSKQLQLFVSTNQPKTQIYNPDNSSYTPNWTSSKPVLTPQLFVAGTAADIIASAKSIKWFVDGTELTASTTDYTLASSGVKTLTINNNVLSSSNSKLFVCEVVYTDPDTGFDVTAKADIEFIKVSSGQKGDTGASGADAIVAVLTNESHTVPTDSAGNNGNFAGAVSTIKIYEGATDVTALWSVTQTRSGVTVTEATTSKTATVTAMSADTGYVEFTASRSGYANIVKRFNLSKNKQGIKGDTGSTGATGQSATAYWLVPEVSAIQKSISGVYTPASFIVSAKYQVGQGSPTAYAGRFIISESTDGVAFTAKYTSSANEASRSYTPSAGIVAVKVQLYLAGGTSNLLDEQIIPIVKDGATGAKGADAVVAVVWTPDGNTIRNANGSLTAKVDVYKAGALVTPSAFKWYIQDPTATTASGGDADGGNGWRLLNATYNAGTTGYTTATLTIPASAISSVESFKCVATYSSVKYTDVCTVMDVSDPIQVVITGTSVFKNGQGDTSLTAKLYRAGVEIDSDGTDGYVYTWSLYNSAGVKSATFGGSGTKTGKTITVASSDIDSRGNIICDVSK